MSKSLGNSLTIRDALKRYNYEVIKYVMFSKHYASDVDILDSDYQIAESHLYYFYTTIQAMLDFINSYGGNESEEGLADDISGKIVSDFIEVMDDDFNTSAALANLHSIFKYANASMKGAKKSNRKATANTMAKILEELHKAYTVLGLFEQDPETFVVELKKKYLKKIEVDEDYINEQI